LFFYVMQLNALKLLPRKSARALKPMLPYFTDEDKKSLLETEKMRAIKNKGDSNKKFFLVLADSINREPISDLKEFDIKSDNVNGYRRHGAVAQGLLSRNKTKLKRFYFDTNYARPEIPRSVPKES
jgi:hypothetical protein